MSKNDGIGWKMSLVVVKHVIRGACLPSIGFLMSHHDLEVIYNICAVSVCDLLMMLEARGPT